MYTCDSSADKVLTQALQEADTPATRAILKDTDAYGFMLTTIIGTIKMASGKPGDIIEGVVDKATGTADIIGKGGNSDTFNLTNATSQMFIQTLSLASLAGKTHPGIILATVGAVFFKKIALAMGLANDNKQAKCIGAFADLSSAVLTTGVATTAAFATGGVATVLAIGAASQLVLAAHEANKACTVNNNTSD